MAMGIARVADSREHVARGPDDREQKRTAMKRREIIAREFATTVLKRNLAQRQLNGLHSRHRSQIGLPGRTVGLPRQGCGQYGTTGAEQQRLRPWKRKHRTSTAAWLRTRHEFLVNQLLVNQSEGWDAPAFNGRAERVMKCFEAGAIRHAGSDTYWCAASALKHANMQAPRHGRAAKQGLAAVLSKSV